MGIENVGQVCVMIHSGSRGFGHQVATGILLLYRRGIKLNFKLNINSIFKLSKCKHIMTCSTACLKNYHVFIFKIQLVFKVYKHVNVYISTYFHVFTKFLFLFLSYNLAS